MLKEVRINEKDTSLFEVVEGKPGEETIPVIRKRVIKTYHYMNNILKSSSNKSCEILPHNCRLIQPNGNSNVVVIEEPPAIKNLRFEYNFGNELADIEKTGIIKVQSMKKMIKPKGINTLKLAFPHTVFIMLIKECATCWEIVSFRVFFKIHPVKRNSDYLYIANVLNLSERNELCFGGSVKLPKPQMQQVDAAESLVREFWVRPFTYEYETRYLKYKKISILNNLLTWAYYTERDPMFIYSSDWVLHNRSLQQEIDTMLLETRGSLSTNTKFNSFFADTVQLGLNDQICFDTLKLTNKVLSVGDQIKIGKEKLYVYNFIGDRDGPTHVVFTDISGKEIEPLKITDYLRKNWDSQLNKQLINYVNSIQIGSEIIKIGDIVKIVSTNTFEVVDNIRIARDGMIELECNSRFYIAIEGNIKVIKSVDANGVELIPNRDYIVCNNQYQHGYIGKLTRVQSDKDMLTVYFKDNVTGNENGMTMNSLEEEDVTILPSDDTKIKEVRTFRYMNRICTNTSNRYLMIKGMGIYDRRGNELETFYHEFNITHILGDIFNSDKTEIFISGIDMDIHFKIGDDVVVGDWEQPEELMLKIRKITGFEVTTNSVSFKLHDKSGDIMVDYIDLLHGIVNVGYIRKVATQINNVPIGTIVVANQAGINNFPKKDRNKIAAFIIDSAEPLVLFQSGLTVWFNDLGDGFDLLLPGTDPYKKIRKIKTLNGDDIKWQAGDLCVNDGKHYLFNNDNPYMGVVYMELHPDFVKTGSLRSRAKVSSELDNSFKRFGIIDPRYLKKNSVINYELIPNFYNGAYKVPFDGYYPYTRRTD